MRGISSGFTKAADKVDGCLAAPPDHKCSAGAQPWRWLSGVQYDLKGHGNMKQRANKADSILRIESVKGTCRDAIYLATLRGTFRHAVPPSCLADTK